MSEYWKSQPRKFCEACKCWFADNKASIEFHERGKRHQENVKRRLERLCKKGAKDFQAKQKYERQMQKIERDALKAFQTDLKNDPNLDCQFNINAAIAVACAPTQRKNPNATKIGKQGRTDPPLAAQTAIPTASVVNAGLDIKRSRWFEAVADEKSYYWNPSTGETQWEAPPEYISLAEQETLMQSSSDNFENCEFGPKAKATPYGEWTTVEIKQEKPIDLQLPDVGKDEIVSITIIPEEKFKFKERTINDAMIPIKMEGETTAFKKRSFSDKNKRNVRQRLDDD